MRKVKVITIVVCLIILSACSGKSESTSIKTILNYPAKDINKVTIIDGTSGNNKILTDQTKIESFLNSLNAIKSEESENQETKEGYRYRVILQADSKKYEFTSSKIGNKYIKSEELISLLDKIYFE